MAIQLLVVTRPLRLHRGLAQRVKEMNAAHLEVLDRPLAQPQADPGQVAPFFRATDGRAKFAGACPFATGCTEFEGGHGAHEHEAG